jgi:hypothetical protein
LGKGSKMSSVGKSERAWSGECESEARTEKTKKTLWVIEIGLGFSGEMTNSENVSASRTAESLRFPG